MNASAAMKAGMNQLRRFFVCGIDGRTKISWH
jgi:hypothetical protein